MKRIILFLAAAIIALLSGVAVFLWSGESPAELEQRGRLLENKIKEIGVKGREGVEQAKEVIKKTPLPAAQPAASQEKPREPANNPIAAAPQKPTPQPASPAPPLEKISNKDKRKLKGILGE